MKIKIIALHLRPAMLSSALLWAAATTARADWTPPESSVTPPTVLTLDAFTARDWNGAEPSAALVVGPDGAFYGSTYYGGSSGYGTLFRFETNGTFTKLHDFDVIDGARPSELLVVGLDGALYGFAGTLFRLDTKGIFTRLHVFKGPDGLTPSSLAVGPDGALYGSTRYGGATWTNGYGYGTLFRLQTNGVLTTLHDFTGLDGIYPSCLMVGPDGALYGSTYHGGSGSNPGFAGYGTLFRLTTNGAFRKLHDFNGTDGDRPSVPLVVGPDGALYGSTFFGGTGYEGVLFRITTGGSFTKLHDFQGPDGYYPSAPLAVGPDGGLYGSTLSGGASGNGTLFQVKTNGIFTKLHDFNGTDGVGPDAALVVGRDGSLYGSTLYSGTNGWGYGYGTLFRLTTNGAFAELHQFSGQDGSRASAASVAGPDGALYGCTWGGGVSGYGTIFRLQTDGTFSSVHEFSPAPEGDSPSELVVGPEGALYGSTRYGGVTGNGTLFRLESNGAFAKLHDFNGTDGEHPFAALVAGPDGALYGSTLYGGIDGYGGTLFRLATDGTFTHLHDFNAGGFCPSAAMVVGPDGALYGSTSYNGELFRLETNGIFTEISLDRHWSEWYLDAVLVAGPDGVLYAGASRYDAGAQPGGCLPGWTGGAYYRLEADGTYPMLYQDNIPSATLVAGPDGALYGSTAEAWEGGCFGWPPGLVSYATVFRLTTNGIYTTLHDFNDSDGSYRPAALVVGADGALYGSTAYGGISNNGTLYQLKTNGDFTKLHDFNGTDGTCASYLPGGTYVIAPALTLGPEGALYGSTPFGGSSDHGTLFRLGTDGAFKKLYDFHGTNGAHPSTAMVLGPDGALYGSTSYGGPRGGGILFKLVLDRETMTPAEALAQLRLTVDSTVPKPEPFLATLSAALASINRGNTVAGINQLHAFQHKVRTRTRRLDPALAQSLVQSAQNIIDSLRN